MSERPDRMTSLLDHLSDDLTSVRLADAEAVRRRGRARGRHQAIGSVVGAVVVVVLVVVGAGLTRSDDTRRSAPPATQTSTPPPTPTTSPTASPSVSAPVASLPTVAQINTALHGCCGAVVAAAETTPTGDCLSSPLTVQGSPVPTRRAVTTGAAGVVVAVTLYRADAGAIGGQLQDVYAACESAAGHHKSFDQAGTTVGGARLVAVTGAPSGGGVAQQYAGWAPAAGGVEVLVQITFTGNGDLGPDQIERLLKVAVDTAKG